MATFTTGTVIRLHSMQLQHLVLNMSLINNN